MWSPPRDIHAGGSASVGPHTLSGISPRYLLWLLVTMKTTTDPLPPRFRDTYFSKSWMRGYDAPMPELVLHPRWSLPEISGNSMGKMRTPPCSGSHHDPSRAMANIAAIIMPPQAVAQHGNLHYNAPLDTQQGFQVGNYCHAVTVASSTIYVLCHQLSCAESGRTHKGFPLHGHSPPDGLLPRVAVRGIKTLPPPCHCPSPHSYSLARPRTHSRHSPYPTPHTTLNKMVVNRKTSVSEQDVLSPRKTPVKDLEAAESSQMALKREASERGDDLPCAATHEEKEVDITDLEEKVDEPLPEAHQAPPEETKAKKSASHPPFVSRDPKDGSTIAIVRSMDTLDGDFKLLEAICTDAVARYKTCTTYTYEAEDERSMGIFFSGERGAADPQPQPPTHLPNIATLPTSPTKSGDKEEQLRTQALAVVHDTIQGGEWTTELKRAFKAIGLAVGVDAYAMYPETFGPHPAKKRGGAAKVKVAVDVHVAEGPAPDAPTMTHDQVDDAPAPPTEKARGKKRARDDDETDALAGREKSLQGRRVRRKKNAAAPPAPPHVSSAAPETFTAEPKSSLAAPTAAPEPSTAQPEAGPHEQAEPEPTGIRRSSRQKKPAEKAVKPLVGARATAPPPTKQRGKKAEAAVEQQPQSPPPQRRRVERERPVLMSKRRPGAPFERTVYYSEGE